MRPRFSTIEIKDILKSWFVISLAFGILITNNLFSADILVNFFIAIFTVGIGFLLHELAHKFLAQKYNYFAEFKADNKMLLIAIATAFFGFLFAAPGGVMIGGGSDNRKLSLIAAAGPVTNIFLALVFFIFSNLTFLNLIGEYGFFINSWLALFNLIPFFPFDGRKIIQGNKILYLFLLAISLVLMLLSLSFR